MPVRAIRCPSCYVEVPLADAITHFRSCDALPAPYVALLVEHLLADTRHATPQLTTTQLLSCPRRTVIPWFFDVSCDPVGRMPVTLGTLLHDHMARFDGPHWVSERCTCQPPFPLAITATTNDLTTYNAAVVDGRWHYIDCNTVRCTFKGVIDGVPLSGRVDAFEVHDDTSITLYDWKFRSSWKSRMTDPTAEDIAQLNINSLLAEQNGFRVRAAKTAQFTWNALPVYQSVPFVTMQEIFRLQPNGGQTGDPRTVGEIFVYLRRALDDHRRGVLPHEILAGLPMVGKEMFKDKYGKSMCTNYCDINETCYSLPQPVEL